MSAAGGQRRLLSVRFRRERRGRRQLGRDNAALFEELVPAQENRQPLLLSRWPDPGQHQAGRYRQRRDHRSQHAGPEFDPAAAADLLQQVLERLDRLVERTASWWCCPAACRRGCRRTSTPPLPHGYKAAGVSVLLDTSGAPLKAALAAGPRIVKPNRHELAELLDRPLDSLASVVTAGRELLHASPAPEWVVVSLGGDGALFLTREHAVQAQSLPVAVTSTVGAGDAMVAGLVAARLEDLSLTETAHWRPPRRRQVDPVGTASAAPGLKSAPWPDRSSSAID